MPAGAIYVGRPTRWGNPFRVTTERTAELSVGAFLTWLTVEGCDAGMPDRKARLLEALPELRDRALVCWCPLGQPCHADVLLELANREEPTP